jgi:hypothetical protein
MTMVSYYGDVRRDIPMKGYVWRMAAGSNHIQH